MDKQKRTAILLWGFTILLLAVIALLLWRTGFFQAIASEDTLAAYIQAFTPWSHLMYFAVQLFSVILAPIPSNLTAAVGGLLFGTLPAFLLTWGAVVLGSLVVFALARFLGQRFVEGLVSRKVSEKYLDLVRRKRDVFLLLAFLFPFFPDDILCILAASPTSAGSGFWCCAWPPAPGGCWWPAPSAAPPWTFPSGPWPSSAWRASPSSCWA